MLTPETRAGFRTLLDAVTLRPGKDEEAAIIYVASDAEPVVVSREMFREQTRCYAAALQRLGIGTGDLVVIASTQSLESIYAFWGALRAGAMPSMFPTLTEKLDPVIYMGSMAELVALSDVRAVLTTDEFAPQLADHVGCPVYATSELTVNAEPEAAVVASDPDAIAFLQHSSGTTGLQKGVALSHTAVLNQIASYSTAIELTESDVVVSWLPLYHDMGLIAGFILPLLQGIPLVLMSPFDWVHHPALLLSAIDRYQGTLTWLPNFAYNHMTRRVRERDLAGLSLSSMRLFINCSEPVRQDSHDQFIGRFAAIGAQPAQLSVSYAMAENTFAVTQTAPGRPPRADVVDGQVLAEELQAKPILARDPKAVIKVSCGRPIPGTAVRVLDEAGAPLAERCVGEIAIQSDCMLTEYYKRPDLQPFHDGWYLTGDRGYMAEGEVFIIGRSKDLIINAGKNVYPQDIEAIVNGVPGVHAGRAVVFGVPDEREGTELIAVVAEVNGPETIEHKEMAKRIRQEIARQSTVTASFVDLVGDKWLIKTSSGKIARAANRDKWLAERNAVEH
jgi:acyl-CoA synthetase (AMP-forming)/AMP-acid ligase II